MRIFIGLLICLLWMAKTWAAEARWLVIASEPVPEAHFKQVGAEIKSVHSLQHKWWYRVVFKPPQPAFQKQWALLTALPYVEWVEPDQHVKPEALPADINQNGVWWQAIAADQLDVQQRTCTGTLVVVLDSGVDIQHPELQPVIWTNPVEEANGVDDDGNGYIDDVHGWDALQDSSVTGDPFGHGTHVAGIIGALNNQEGVAGLCAQVEILPLRFLNKYGAGYISDAVEALQYLVDLIDKGQFSGKHIVLNNSWVIGSYSLALEMMLDALHEKGVLVVNAAGNQGWDIARYPMWPASFAQKRIWQVAVGNADVTADSLAPSSNYNVQSVTVAAPGVNIVSTWPGGRYQAETGTSMAAPVVTALAAMLWSSHPAWSAEEVRAVIEAGVESKQAFLGKVKAQGWVHFVDTLQTTEPQPLLGYMKDGRIYGVHLDQIDQLTLLGQPLPITFEPDSKTLKFDQPEALKCGYLHANMPHVKPLYLNVVPAPPEQFEVQLEPGRWVLSWNTHENVDQVLLQGLNALGEFVDIMTLDNKTQSATLSPLEGYSKLRLVAQMQCEGEDRQSVVRRSDPSAVFELAEAPLWLTVALSPGAVSQRYAIALAVEQVDALQLGAEHNCAGLTLQGTYLTGTPLQSGQCTVDIEAHGPTGQKVRFKKTLSILSQAPETFNLADGLDVLPVTLSGVEGFLGATLERWGQDWAVKLVVTPHAEGVVQLTAPNQKYFKVDQSAYALSPDKKRMQVALSQLQAEKSETDKKVYALRFRLESEVVPSSHKDTRCFFASYLFGRTAWQTETLRLFRDRVLLRLPGGAELVKVYYHTAPNVLVYLQQHTTLAQGLKGVLQRLFSPWVALFHFMMAV